MSLKQQFQVFIGTIVISMFYCFIYSVFNSVFYKKHKTIFRFVFELPLFLAFVYIYFIFLVCVCDAILNIHYSLAVFLGVFIYQKYYAKHINMYLDIKLSKIKKRFYSPIKLKWHKICAIIKKRRSKNEQEQKSNR